MGPRTLFDSDGEIVGVRYKAIDYPDRESLPNELIDGRSIRELHGRGWDRLGYSDLFHRSGGIENITPYNDDDWVGSHEMTWGASGVNSIARHICLEGGRNGENESRVFKFAEIFPDALFVALVGYVNQFLKDHPGDKIAGHYMFTSRKTCPNFLIEEFFGLAGINSKHMYRS